MIRKSIDMRSEIRENMRGGPGAVEITHLLDKEDFTARLRLCGKLTLKPGAGIGRHKHEDEDEIYILTKGCGVVDEGDGEKPVQAGDAVLTGNGSGHSVRNTGTEDMEIIAVIILY